MIRRLVMVVSLMWLGCDAGSAEEVAVLRQGLEAVTGFGSNPGNLLMFREVPAGLPRGRPLLVTLHGCGDPAENFATGSGLLALAAQRQFAVLAPQQQAANNIGSQTCFNWFEGVDQARGGGEMLSIVQMVDRMVADVGSDPSRVVIAGFSAGGAHAVNLITTYPDRFSAAVAAAGVPYKCADTITGAFTCLNNGVDLTPQTWASRARMAFQSYTGPYPRVSLWQGGMDGTVNPLNLREAMEQWTAVHGLDQMVDGTATIAGGGTRSLHRANPNSPVMVEVNEFPSLGHTWRAAWATDMADFLGLTAPTGGGAAGGGAAAGGSAGGAVTSGGSAGGGSAGGGSAGGSAGGAVQAGGSAQGGGQSTAGGSVATGGGSAGGMATGGQGGTSIVTPPSMGCQSCNASGGAGLLGLLALGLLRRRR